jgi:hypothetical protein
VLSGAVTSSEKASAESDGVIDEIVRRVHPFPNENAVTWTINSRSTDTVMAVGLEPTADLDDDELVGVTSRRSR